MNNLDSRIALVRHLQAATRKLTSRSNFCPALLQSASFSSPCSAGTIAGCVNGLSCVACNSSDPEKGKVFSTGRRASRDLPLSRTDKCNFSIMISDHSQSVVKWWDCVICMTMNHSDHMHGHCSHGKP